MEGVISQLKHLEGGTTERKKQDKTEEIKKYKIKRRIILHLRDI